MLKPTAAALSQPVTDVLRRAQHMVADGKNSTAEVAALIGDIGRLPDGQRKELFDAFDAVKQQSGAPKSREAVEVFLGALRDKPAQLLAKLEGDDGVIDMKDAMRALAELGQGGAITGHQRVSVFTMMLIAKTTPEAREALLNVAQNGTLGGDEIDHLMRGFDARGGATAQDMNALKAGAGTDPYACYMLSYWSMVLPAEKFAPGGKEALAAAAEETFTHVPRHYREDLELNRGRSPTLKGARTLDVFARETLRLPYKVTFAPPSYDVDVNGAARKYARPDDLAAFLIETALKSTGHAIDSVRWDASDSVYVVTKGNVEERKRFHSELLRDFGYNA